MTEAAVHVKTEERLFGRIATVTVDNQRRLNCLASATIVALTQAFTKLSEDDGLRAIVLTGAGDKAFIGGADLNELGALLRRIQCAFTSRGCIWRASLSAPARCR